MTHMNTRPSFSHPCPPTEGWAHVASCVKSICGQAWTLGQSGCSFTYASQSDLWAVLRKRKRCMHTCCTVHWLLARAHSLNLQTYSRRKNRAELRPLNYTPRLPRSSSHSSLAYSQVACPIYIEWAISEWVPNNLSSLIFHWDINDEKCVFSIVLECLFHQSWPWVTPPTFPTTSQIISFRTTASTRFVILITWILFHSS